MANITDFLSKLITKANVVQAISAAITELKSLDSLLTKISKTSDLTKAQLKELGDSAFEAAGKYGKTAADYLTSLEKMYQAGFRNAEQMAKLSLLAQAAGDMAPASADNYLIASDAAYHLKGNAEELNQILDGQIKLSKKASISLSDMAQATSESAFTAAQCGVQIDELSALIAITASKTHASGAEIGNALKSLFISLQDAKSGSVKEALETAHISMTKLVNDSPQLKTPIQLLDELAGAFSRFSPKDTKGMDILSALGGPHADILSSILTNWTAYEEMLLSYSQAAGSAAKAAEDSSSLWEDSLNRLSNTWTKTISNIVDSDMAATIISSFNGILSIINKVTDAFGSFGGIGFGAGLFSSLQNIGKRRISVRIPKTALCYLF